SIGARYNRARQCAIEDFAWHLSKAPRNQGDDSMSMRRRHDSGEFSGNSMWPFAIDAAASQEEAFERFAVQLNSLARALWIDCSKLNRLQNRFASNDELRLAGRWFRGSTHRCDGLGGLRTGLVATSKRMACSPLEEV